MSSTTPPSRVVSSFKYAYLLVFFMLLSGLFQPLISGSDGDKLVAGVMILSLGLLGGTLLWRSAYNEDNRVVYMGLGFGLIAGSLYLIFLVA